jgi:hypothetical protein
LSKKLFFCAASTDGAPFYRMLAMEPALSLRVSTTTPHRG